MVTIRFFAAIKQKVGREQIEVELDTPVSVGNVIKQLEARVPDLSQAISETRSLIAVNHEYSDKNTLVNNGDEIAFIPPMSGGGQNLIRIQKEDFSIEDEVNRIKNLSKRIGGIVTFLGTARELSRGRKINQLEFEYYPVMAEKKLSEIRQRALKDYDVIEISIIHRYGKIAIGDNIVLIIAAAEHRASAFDACEWSIDELKKITPIWKKEITDSGDIWVEDHP